MNTFVKAALGVGLLTLGGIALTRLFGKRKEVEQPENNEPVSEKVVEESTVLFDIESHELSVKKMKPGDLCEIGKERVGVIKNVKEHDRFRALNSKKNAKLIKEKALTLEEVRSLWLYALETQSKEADISKYIQDTYIRESAEKVKEIINQEEQS